MPSLAIIAHNEFTKSMRTISVTKAVRLADPYAELIQVRTWAGQGQTYEFSDGSRLVVTGRGRAHRIEVHNE